MLLLPSHSVINNDRKTYKPLQSVIRTWARIVSQQHHGDADPCRDAPTSASRSHETQENLAKHYARPRHSHELVQQRNNADCYSLNGPCNVQRFPAASNDLLQEMLTNHSPPFRALCKIRVHGRNLRAVSDERVVLTSVDPVRALPLLL